MSTKEKVFEANLIVVDSSALQCLPGIQIEAQYQPIVDLVSGVIVGLEVLLRHKSLCGDAQVPSLAWWNKLNATQSGVPLATWLVHEVLDHTAQSDFGNRNVYLSLNVRHTDLLYVDLVDSIRHLLSILLERGFRGLKLEITEHHEITNYEEVANVVASIQNLGIEVMIDDFGTGFCGLASLALIPCGTVKIDRIVSKNLGNQSGETLAENVVRLCQKLRKKVIIEGIETPEQYNYFRDLGAELGQGYLFGGAATYRNIPININPDLLINHA